MQNNDDEEWGRLHVTRGCCGAGTCRNFAPELLGEIAPADERLNDSGEARRLSVLPGSYEPGAFTGVLRQPRSKEELVRARTAVAACPFGALRLEPPRSRVRPGELGSPWGAFPQRIEDNVWVLGHLSPQSIGAISYFIELEGGGILIDTPKPNEAMFRWLEEHGGVRWLLLTHRDHTRHHAEFAARFPGCRRILGAADVSLRPSEYHAVTSDVEIKLGDEPRPLTLEGAPIPEDALAGAEIAVIPQPGHTPGSLCLLYRGRFLFTGDHLSYSRRVGHLVAHRLQCWEDWERQTRSVRHLAAMAEAGHLRFAWVLPGHAEWQRLEGDGSAAATATALGRTVAWMERKPPGHVPLNRYIPFVESRMKPRSKLARVVRALGGEGPGNDAWVLPRGAWSSLPDYDPEKTNAALRRVYALGGAALAAVAGVAWLTVRAVKYAQRA